jgi:membrane-associated phospholipid phosphatase
MSVFPSAHVSGSFSAAFGMMGLVARPVWIGRAMLVLAVLIAISTVYGRYHYAADAAAGLTIAVVAWMATTWMYGTNSRRA